MSALRQSKGHKCILQFRFDRYLFRHNRGGDRRGYQFSGSGTIEQLPVHVGQYVKAGQLIASVNPATLQNTYDAAAATLTQARDAYERMKQLHERGSIPEIQWVEAQSKLSQAESSERIAKKNLADCRLVAPYSVS